VNDSSPQKLSTALRGKTFAPIPGSGERERTGQQLAIRLRLLSRLVAVPALTCMVGGLLAYWPTTMFDPGGIVAVSEMPPPLPGPVVVPMDGLMDPSGSLAGFRAMSVGLLALIALPGGIVLLILVEQLRRRRWTEAMVALGVFSIIVISFLITRR
jgi:hypothetical protein